MSVNGVEAASVQGYVEPGFEAVMEAFARNLESGVELGGAFAAHVDGRQVVDIRGGVRDRTTGKAYGEDTLQLIFSATKGVAALCLHLLGIDVDQPVSRWWPEFAESGKEDLPLRWLLSHMAGLPTVDRRLSPAEVFEWEPVCEALAAQQPLWEPGTAFGYHALTYGWLVGEVFRRASGQTIGRFVAEQISGPLGLDLWIGLPSELNERVSPVEMGPDLIESPGLDPEGLLVRTGTLNHALGPLREWINEPATWATELPAGNAICDARSLSRLYASAIGPVDGSPQPLLSECQIRDVAIQQNQGYDLVFGSAGVHVDQPLGLGFFLPCPNFPFGGPGSFGHPGASGSLGLADPDRRLACGYVTNSMKPTEGPDPRCRALVDALYDSIDGASGDRPPCS